VCVVGGSANLVQLSKLNDDDSIKEMQIKMRDEIGWQGSVGITVLVPV